MVKGLALAPPGNRVQHRRLDFQKVVRHHELADAADRLAARHKALAGGLVGHQVDIALAVFLFLVGHAVELVGHRAQALGQQAHAGGVDRELAGFGLEDLAFGGHDVAQVPVLEAGVNVGADIFALDVDLDAPGAVLQGGKAGLAHDALEHHAPGDFGRGALLDQAFRRLAGVGGKQVGGVVGGLEIVGEGDALAFELLLAQGFELFAPLQDQLVFVLGGGGCGLIRHEGGAIRN